MPSIIASEMELCGIPVPKRASTAELRKFAHAVVMAAGGYNTAAHVLEVGAGTLWNLINETQQDSPTLRKRWAIHKTNRVRLSADLDSEEQREALKRLASNQGKSWSEYCKWMADIMEKV